jgi:hypothetical protein
MRKTIAEGAWRGGTSKLSIILPGDGVEAVDGYSRERIGYEFDSEYDEVVDANDPTPIVFYPEELRDVIAAVREELEEDPFAPEPDFDVLEAWLDENGAGVLGEVGDRDGLHKQFRMKRSEKGTPYLKVQRGQGRGYLRATPTLGRTEFEELFGSIAVI